MLSKINYIIVILLVCMCTLICVAETKFVDCPLCLYLEGNVMATGMYLKCDVVDYKGISYNNYVADGKNAIAKCFKDYIGVLKSGNASELKKMVFKKDNMSAKEKEEFDGFVTKEIKTSSGFFTEDKFGQNFSDLIVFSEIYLGKDIYVVYGTENMDKAQWPVRLMLNFERVGNYIYPDVRGADMTFLLLQDIVSQMFRKTNFNDIGDKKFDYEIIYPGTEGPNQAYLRFNGKKYNLNVMKEQVDPKDDVARLFQRQYELDKISSEAVAEVYGGDSKIKYLEWLQVNRSLIEARRARANSQVQDKIIRFILDASPLYIVFYQNENSEQINYQFIVRDSADGNLAIRNWFVIDYFKQWLDSPEIQKLFRTIILETE